MDWNRYNITSLIHYFKEKRELWDTSCADFKDRNVKHAAWKDLADKMNLDRKVVETKMRSLIGQFQRELRKTSSDNATSRWYGFNLLLFLKDVKKQGPVNHHHNSPDTLTIAVLNENVTRHETPTVGSMNESIIIKSTYHEVFDEGTSNKKERKQEKKEEHEPPKKLRRVDVPKIPLETNMVPKPMPVNYKTRDDYSIFGEYIASKLRSIHDPFTVSTVQHQINNIIYQAEVSLNSAASIPAPSYYVIPKSEPESSQHSSLDQLETDEEEEFDDILKSMQR